MTFLAISGPEKAGKSTLIEALAKEFQFPYIRHWSGPATDQRNTRMLHALRADYATEAVGQPVIWDRSWLCHNVYGFLLQHPCNETVRFPLLSEWLYGRAVSHLGAKFVLLPSSWQETHARRDETDLPVHARFEYNMYKELGESLGWTILENDYTERGLQQNIETILASLTGKRTQRLEELVSPPQARVCFVGEKPTEARESDKGEWLPFTEKNGWEFAKMLGNDSLKFAWAYSHRLPPQHLRDYNALITFGELPYIWAKNYVGHKKVIALPKLSHVVSRKYDGDWPSTHALITSILRSSSLRSEETPQLAGVGA